ncbi:hypothetical protein D3C80_1527950 [compost metagenome]
MDGAAGAEQLGDIDIQRTGGSGQFFIADRHLRQLHFRQRRHRHAAELRQLLEGQLTRLAYLSQTGANRVAVKQGQGIGAV